MVASVASVMFEAIGIFKHKQSLLKAWIMLIRLQINDRDEQSPMELHNRVRRTLSSLPSCPLY